MTGSEQGVDATVDSTGVRLAVRSCGPSDAPVVVAVHGFPDTRAMWDPVVERLARDHHVVTFDVRGAGASTAPASRAGYAARYLVDDHVAVLDHVTPDRRPVHLLGHDWGSVQLWETVLHEGSDARLRGRIASFTSISGAPLRHYARHLRGAVRRRDVRAFADQARRSWYVAAFQVPVLPELVLRRLSGRVQQMVGRADRLGPDAHWAPTFAEDAARGINLYRANARGTGSPPRTEVPVRLLVPRRDPFLSPALYAGIERMAPNLEREDVEGGHWLPRTDPDLVADRVRASVAAHGADPAG